jgi:hypothetical protein
MTSPLPAEGTQLVLSVGGVPLYSARDLEQTLTPIKAAANTRRTVNGLLVDLSVSNFHKYQSTIKCQDIEAPALDGVMPGMTLTVDCVAELVFKTAGGTPSRTVVAGSARTVGAYTIYRPRLSMMVTALEQSLGEYGHATSWSLELEEI